MKKVSKVNPPRLIHFREYRRGFQTPHGLSSMPATFRQEWIPNHRYSANSVTLSRGITFSQSFRFCL